MKKLYILILSIFLLVGCTNNNIITTSNESKSNNKLADGAYINTKDVEIYDISTIESIINDTNVEITNLDKSINTDELGKHNINIDYKYNEELYTYSLEYNVIDTQKPILLSAPSTLTYQLEDDTNPCDSFNYADNQTRIPKCEIIGDYDVTQIGNYTVKYKISDESNNYQEGDLTIKIVKELPTNNNKNEPKVTTTTDIATVINKYKNNNTSIGLDVSKYQGDIDFSQVKEAGVEFVIIKLGNYFPDDGFSFDTKFEQNYKNAKANNLKIGLYIYTNSTREEFGKEVGKAVIDNIKDLDIDLPIAFDWENWYKFKSYESSIHDLGNTYRAFAKVMKDNNYTPMLYGSKYYLENIWEKDLVNNDNIWLAHYTDSKTNYQGKHIMWQLCNDGRVNGINGDVDINVLYK